MRPRLGCLVSTWRLRRRGLRRDLDLLEDHDPQRPRANQGAHQTRSMPTPMHVPAQEAVAGSPNPPLPRSQGGHGPLEVGSGVSKLVPGDQEKPVWAAGSLESQLAQAVRGGDVERSGQILASLLLPLAPVVAKWARIAGIDVDDLLSEIYLRAWPHLRKLTWDGGRDLLAYLRGIGRNVALQAEPRRVRERSYVALNAVEVMGALDASLEELDEDESCHTLEQRLASVLPGHYVEALKLRAAGCRLSEVADALGKSVPACKDILRHAKEAAKDALS